MQCMLNITEQRCCLSLSHLFIILCRKGECKNCHYLCWLTDWGCCSQKGLSCTHQMQCWGCSSTLTLRVFKTVLSDPARTLAYGTIIPLLSHLPMPCDFLTSETVWNPCQVWSSMTPKQFIITWIVLCDACYYYMLNSHDEHELVHYSIFCVHHEAVPFN